jgi:hypothetical protein
LIVGYGEDEQINFYLVEWFTNVVLLYYSFS